MAQAEARKPHGDSLYPGGFYRGGTIVQQRKSLTSATFFENRKAAYPEPIKLYLVLITSCFTFFLHYVSGFRKKRKGLLRRKELYIYNGQTQDLTTLPVFAGSSFREIYLQSLPAKQIPRSKSEVSKSRPRWVAHTRIGNVWEYPPPPGFYIQLPPLHFLQDMVPIL